MTKKSIAYLSNEVCNAKDKGWLSITKSMLLPFTTKVAILETHSNSQTVEILEGVYNGTITKVKHANSKANTHYFTTDSVPRSKAKILLRTKTKELVVNGKIKIHSLEFPEHIQKGLYKVLLPSNEKHNLPSTYFNEMRGGSRFASTWFQFVPTTRPSIYESQQFIHLGSYSTGCITVKYTASKHSGGDWQHIYYELLQCRDGDGVLGELIIE